MARTPEPDVPIDVAVRPAATQVDTYVRPETPAPSPLHAVADALAPLSADLFALAGQQKAAAAKADTAAGEASFWNQNQAGAAAGVASGQIPPDKSPHWQAGYAGMAGINDAANLNQRIGPDYTALDKTTQDPQAFDHWFFPYVRQHANPSMFNNPAYAHQWASQVAQLHARLSSQYVTDRTEALKAGAFQKFSGSLGNTIGEHFYNEGGNPDPIKLGESLDSIRQVATGMGMEKAQVDKGLVDVVTTKAIELKSAGLLQVLKQLPADPKDPAGVKLGETEYGNASSLQAAKTINTGFLQDQEHQQKINDRKDQDASNGALRDVLTKWSTDLNYQPSEAEIATISKPSDRANFRSTMATLRNNISKGDVVEDPKAKAVLYDDMFRSGDTVGNIERAIRNGTLKTNTSIDEAFKYGNIIENYGKTGGANKITEDPAFKTLTAAISQKGRNTKLATTIFGEEALSDAGRQALYDARISAMTWATQHPNASPVDRIKFLYEMGKPILDGLAPPEASAGAAPAEMQPTYTPPVGAPSGGVATQIMPSQTPSGAPGAAPPVPQVLPQPSPQNNAPAASPAGRQGAIGGGDQMRAALAAMPAAPRFEDLPGMGVPPAMIQQLTTGAKGHGVQPQELLQRLWEQARSPGKQGGLDLQQQAQPIQTAEAGMPAAQPVSIHLPGGGRVDLHGISPEVGDQITQMVERYSRLSGGGTAGASSGGPTGASSAVSPSRVASIDAMPVGATIDKVAQETGFDPSKLKAIVSIESGGRSNASTGSYHGLLQLSQAEFKKYGEPGADIKDPEANLRAGIKSLQDKAVRFRSEFGRDPSPTELYLMHQQGEAGLRSHEQNPNQLAWQSMKDTGEGRAKGSHWAKMAIWGNVPSDMKAMFGSVDNITSAEFMALWRHKLEGIPYQTALNEITSRSAIASSN